LCLIDFLLAQLKESLFVIIIQIEKLVRIDLFLLLLGLLHLFHLLLLFPPLILLLSFLPLLPPYLDILLFCLLVNPLLLNLFDKRLSLLACLNEISAIIDLEELCCAGLGLAALGGRDLV